MPGDRDMTYGLAPPADLDWEGGAPRSRRFADIYFSGDGEAETAHVFLAGNNLEARFAAARRFAVGELGFGSGLNFLKCWSLWDAVKKPADARLDFFSVEAFPLGSEDMSRAHAAWPGLGARAARLRAVLPPPARGFQRIDVAPDVTLTLAYGDALAMLARAEGAMNAWFFDGFSPAANPEMWRTEIFNEAARLSKPGATFATFTVAGAVRRALGEAGFAPEKRPGFGRKKEMLAGVLAAPPRRSRRAPWFQAENLSAPPHGARIAIIGGGVAGASLAYAARRAGLRPTVIESEAPAAGASGNPGGLIMPRLDLGGGPAARFFLAAYLHTIRLLTDLEAAGGESLFSPCGALLGAATAEGRARLDKIAAAALLPPDWLEWREDGLFFPQAGVVAPAAFVRRLIAGAETVIAPARRIARAADGTLSVETDKGALGPFDAVILAHGVDALRFAEARTLPLVPVGGQIDWFPEAAAPPHALAYGPYAAPAPGGGLLIGATYDRLARGAEPSPTRAASEANIAAIAGFAPGIAARLDPRDSRPRASRRCQTPDRLPVAGPLPDIARYGAEYDDLRLGARRAFPPGAALPGVFILSGLGARGLVTAPLAAAMIVAEMTGAPAPVDHEIAEALHPARFFIRDLKRARTIRKG